MRKKMYNFNVIKMFSSPALQITPDNDVNFIDNLSLHEHRDGCRFLLPLSRKKVDLLYLRNCFGWTLLYVFYTKLQH